MYHVMYTLVFITLLLHFALSTAKQNCTLVVPVCVSVPCHMTTLLHTKGCNWGEWQEVPPSCAILSEFAIGAQVSLLWHHTHLMQNVSKNRCTHCMADYAYSPCFTKNIIVKWKAFCELICCYNCSLIGHSFHQETATTSHHTWMSYEIHC